MANHAPRRRTPSRSKSSGRSKTARPVRRAAVARRVLQKRRSPESLRVRSITAGFTVNDLERSLIFYTEVLGFIVKQRMTSDDGKLQGVMLQAGACELGLSQDDWSKGRERKKGEGVRVGFETVQDVDALAERIKSAGVRLTHEPKDGTGGARALALDDPDGYHLTIYREG